MNNSKDIIQNFKKEILNSVPKMFIGKPSLKKEFLQRCVESMVWDYSINITPCKFLNYNNFAAYINNLDGTKISWKEFEDIIQDISKTMKSVFYKLKFGYALFDYLEFINIFDWASCSDISRKQIVFKTHSPYLLYIILKNWKNIPKPNHADWMNIEEGLIPIYEDFVYYCHNVITVNNVIFSKKIINDVLGVEYFSLLLEEAGLYENIGSNAQDAIINVLCLMKYLPSIELQKLFYKQFVFNFNLVKDSQKDLRNYLGDFIFQVMMFLRNYNTDYWIKFNYSITYKYNSIPVISSPGCIKEMSFSSSLQDIIDIQNELLGRINPSKRSESAEKTLANLKRNITNPSSFKKQLFIKYWGFRNPLNCIENNSAKNFEEGYSVSDSNLWNIYISELVTALE